MAKKSMIERVARELCRHDGLPENIRFEGRSMWTHYVAKAQTAITAMREPTEAMLEAGNCTAEQWSRMIGAALKQGD